MDAPKQSHSLTLQTPRTPQTSTLTPITPEPHTPVPHAPTPHQDDPEVAAPHEGLYTNDKTQHSDWHAARAPEFYRPPHEYRQEAAPPTICGLKPWQFWTWLFVVVLILGGAIGGGLGGGLAAQGKYEDSRRPTASSPSPTSSPPTSTASSFSTSTTTDSIDCPSRTGQLYTATNRTTTFLQLCGVNICPETCDIVPAKSKQLTFEACMDNCAAYNSQVGTQKCVAVAWDYQQVRQSFDYVCWLKLSQAPLVKDDPTDGLTVGAVVVQT